MLYIVNLESRSFVANAVSAREAACEVAFHQFGMRAEDIAEDVFNKIVPIPEPEPGQSIELRHG